MLIGLGEAQYERSDWLTAEATAGSVRRTRTSRPNSGPAGVGWAERISPMR